MKDVLVVCAMPIETEIAWHSLNLENIVTTGIGVVNASMVLTAHLKESKNKPDCVINFGFAGATDKYKIGDCVRIGESVMTSYYDKVLYGTLSSKFCLLGEERCCTSTSFVTNETYEVYKDSNIFDMELFAVASVCSELKISCYSLKIVSDIVNATNNYKEYEKTTEFRTGECSELLQMYNELTL